MFVVLNSKLFYTMESYFLKWAHYNIVITAMCRKMFAVKQF